MNVNLDLLRSNLLLSVQATFSCSFWFLLCSVSMDTRKSISTFVISWVRAISWGEPFSLAVVAQLINGAGFSRVRILDAHSEAATRLIRNSVNVLPFKVVRQVIDTIAYPSLVCPDKGAVPRVRLISQTVGGFDQVIHCQKIRVQATGELKGFEVLDKSLCSGKHVLIVDDICDGGGTFVGLAKELRKAGAKKVFLYVTHGIFSKGLPLEGIDHIYTTDSYPNAPWDIVKCSTESEDETDWNRIRDTFTVIPISMKEL